MSFCIVNLLDRDNIKKLRLSSFSWEELLNSPQNIYETIVNLILSKVNLYYYATLKESTKTLEDTKKYVEKLIQNGLLKESLNDIFKTIGWGGKDFDINNTVFQGDFAEYLMSILVDKFTEIDTLISKVSLKTSPRVPSFGNDNIYYDYANDILYYGEAKFYSDIKLAIKRAVESLIEHAGDEEISYIRSHTSAFIADNGEKRIKIIEKMESILISDVTVKKIFFIMNDDVYKKTDYEELLLKYFSEAEGTNEVIDEIIMIFLPVISKKGLLEYFEERLSRYEE